jgi:hypothetical protein
MPLHLELPSRKDARFTLRVSGAAGWGAGLCLDSVETTGASHARRGLAVEALDRSVGLRPNPKLAPASSQCLELHPSFQWNRGTRRRKRSSTGAAGH